MVIEELVEIIRYLRAQDPRNLPGDQNDQQSSIDEVWDAIERVDPMGARVVRLLRPLRTVDHRIDRVYLSITEQPAPVRFRYECEGRLAGSIPGVNSRDLGTKTYPTIMLHGYVGRVLVLVSLVTKDAPYRVHPHKLVGKGCVRGICVVAINMTDEGREYQFKHLGIQYVKRSDIGESLADRARLRIDPFRNKFDHGENRESIALSAVRLCFQVFSFVEGGDNQSLMQPVVSDVIFDKKSVGVLHISRTSHCSGTAMGGTQVIILCDKVTADDIEVVFYNEVWEAIATKILVHKQVAILIETPAYLHPDTTEHVNVYFQLKRLSVNARSNSLPFEYIPEFTGVRNKKRKVINSELQNYVLSNWAPPMPQESSPSLPQQMWDLTNLHIDPGHTRADQAMPGLSHVDLEVPGSSHVDLAERSPSHVELAVPGSIHVDPALPGPSHVDRAMPESSDVDLAIPGPSHVDPRIPRSSHANQAVLDPSHRKPFL